MRPSNGFRSDVGKTGVGQANRKSWNDVGRRRGAIDWGGSDHACPGFQELTLVARLQLRLGDQPIDVIVIEPGENLTPIQSIALQQGARL